MTLTSIISRALVSNFAAARPQFNHCKTVTLFDISCADIALYYARSLVNLTLVISSTAPVFGLKPAFALP